MLKTAAIGLGFLCCLGVAHADEVEVHPGPGPAVVAPGGADSKTVVHEHESGTGCESKTVHKENGEGDSKTVSQSNC